MRVDTANRLFCDSAMPIEISGTSFRLQAVDADRIPNNFTLLFSKSGPGRHASVIWPHGTEIGGEFSIANLPQPHVSRPAL
jgi:hypothetical protein